MRSKYIVIGPHVSLVWAGFDVEELESITENRDDAIRELKEFIDS